MSLYAAIDLKSFYASVECIERGLDPLTTNLVVADHSRTEKTICLAVSPSLKAYGISGRARLFEVIQKVNDIKNRTGEVIEYIQAQPRMAKYTEYSARVFSVYLKYVSPDDIHPYSIDEVFMNIEPYLKLYNMTAHELVKSMIREVLYTTGITATAGIGTNLYLAKIAMDIVAKHVPADSEGVRIAELDEMSYRKKLWDHKPLTDFWRIGPATERKLNSMHIYTMGDIAEQSYYDPRVLYTTFKSSTEEIIDHAWGYEPCTIEHIKQYKPKSNSISSGQVLQEPYDNKKAKLIVKEMIELVALELVEKGLMTSKLTLTIGYDRINVDSGTISGKEYTGKIHKNHYGQLVPVHSHGTANIGQYTASTIKMRQAIVALFDRITDKDLWVRRITISADNLASSTEAASGCTSGDVCEGEQLSFFTDDNSVSVEESTEKFDKEKKMQQAVVSLRKRFGKNAVIKGMNLEKGATTIDRNQQIGGHKA